MYAMRKHVPSITRSDWFKGGAPVDELRMEKEEGFPWEYLAEVHLKKEEAGDSNFCSASSRGAAGPA